MGITKVIPTYNTKSLLKYLEEVKYEDRVRNVGYFSVGVNTTNPYQSFKTLLANKGKLNRIRLRNDQERVYEGQHIITSFTQEELNPEREEDIEKARKIMQDLMMDDYHKYGAVSVGYLQNDNGFLHFHRLYPTVAKDGKALRGEVYNFYHCAHKLDNMMEKHGVNQSILTMKERAEGYSKGDKLEGPIKNNRNEIKAYIAGVIDEGLKDVNINNEDKFKEYLESKDISLNKRKRVGDSRDAGYDIYDWTYEYHYVDKGPKLKDKSMKVRAKQITDENSQNIYTPDPIAERLALNLKEFNRIAEENRKKREEEDKKKEKFNTSTVEMINTKKILADLKKRQRAIIRGSETTSSRFKKRENEVEAKEEVKPIEDPKPKEELKVKNEINVEVSKPSVIEDSKDKNGNGIDEYHEYVVNKRVSEIEELSKLDEDEVVTEEDLIEEARKEEPKTTKVKADLNRKSPFKKTYTKSQFNDLMRLGAELNAQLEEKDDGYGY
jgi:hypothetical protein